MAPLEYIVTPVDARAHRFRVVLQTDVVADQPLELALPSWIAAATSSATLLATCCRSRLRATVRRFLFSRLIVSVGNARLSAIA
jgi:hypothetical protein